MSASPNPTPTGSSGVLVIDKATGITSHDVVQQVRRALGTRRVGHAGTLDPLASGVLVVMVGEATKLGPYLTSEDKSYFARVRLGVATSTLDAEGQIVAESALPGWLADQAQREQRLAVALQGERQRTEQQPPVYSAIKVAGRAAYARARAGESLTLTPRPVEVRALELQQVLLEPTVSSPGVGPARAALELSLRVRKGYYVRSLARDLGVSLGLPAHLEVLRRLSAGAFGLADAVPLTAPPDELRARLIDLGAAVRSCLPTVTLTAVGRQRASLGQPLEPSHFAQAAPGNAIAGWLDEAGGLVAIGRHEPDCPARVLRGFGRPGAQRGADVGPGGDASPGR